MESTKMNLKSVSSWSPKSRQEREEGRNVVAGDLTGPAAAENQPQLAIRNGHLFWGQQE